MKVRPYILEAQTRINLTAILTLLVVKEYLLSIRSKMDNLFEAHEFEFEFEFLSDRL